MRAFNRPVVQTSKLPASFYFRPRFSTAMTAPVRGNLKNCLWPILYSDVWGDYWVNFVVYAGGHGGQYVQGPRMMRGAVRKSLVESNLKRMVPYLARVNRVSLLPTGIMLIGLASGVATIIRLAQRREAISPSQAVLLFATIAVIGTLAGYVWFLANYADDSDDTVKGVYVLQMFPFLAVLGAVVLDRVAVARPRLGVVVTVVLTLVWLHNLPAMRTHYPADAVPVPRAR